MFVVFVAILVESFHAAFVFGHRQVMMPNHRSQIDANAMVHLIAYLGQSGFMY